MTVTDTTPGASERRVTELSEMLERLTGAFFALNTEWHFTYVNAAAGRLMQRDPASLIGRSMWEEFPEAVDSRFYPEYQRAVRDGVPVTVTEWYPPLGAWFEVTAYPGATGLTVYFHNVTERIRFEQARERQDQMLGAVDVGMWYCDLPFDELIWDRKVKEHFWLPPDARVTIETFYERIHPDDREPTRQAIEHSIASHSPYDIEYRTIAPDDHVDAGAERWVRAIGYTGYAPDGSPLRFDGITVDITSAKRVAERLAASEQRYEYAALATSNAIWDWTFATNHVAWNAGVHTVFGFATDAVDETAAWWYEHIHPDDRERVVTGIHAVIDEVGGRIAWTDEYRFRRASGEYARVIDRGYVARDASGVATRMIGAMEDVTARREAEEALERSNKDLDQFAYVASHDLKAPLRGIANLAQWIEEDLGDRLDGESVDHMRLLKGRVHRMEGLIDGILTYSRAARGRGRREAVDTGALLAEVLDLVAAPPGAVEVAADMPTVRADRVPLQQVFMNLVGNALKHGRADEPAGGARVRVAWREAEQGMVEFTVADEGPGIAPEFHQRIWGIFQTLEARDKVESTGIGLAVVKKIVESRGGRAWVESTPGRGATFHFTWPR